MTYGGLALAVLSGVVVLHLVCLVIARVRGTLPPRYGLAVATTALVLTVLTVVFDSLMISVDLFRFDESQLSGIRVWLAPIEDLAWPLAAALALPAVWTASAPKPEVDDE